MATVTKALEIFERQLTYSNAPEPGAGEIAYDKDATYAAGDLVIVGSPSHSATITIATPGIWTWTAHQQPEGAIAALSTTGVLPTPFDTSTPYYFVNVTADTFQLAGKDGAPISTSGSQSGTHTVTTQIHRKFKSLQAANHNNYPLLDASSEWWEDVGPTNRWASIDIYRNTQTFVPSPYVIELTPGVRVDTIFIGGLVGNIVHITQMVDSEVVFDETINLDSRVVLGLYDYFFKAFRIKPTVFRTDLAPISQSVIRIEVTRVSGMVGVGSIALGSHIYIGEAEDKPTASADNFSTIDRDAFGNSILIQRRTAPSVSMTVHCDKDLLPDIEALQLELNAVPAIFSGVDDDTDPYFEPLLVLGVYGRWDLQPQAPDNIIQIIEVKEV